MVTPSPCHHRPPSSSGPSVSSCPPQLRRRLRRSRPRMARPRLVLAAREDLRPPRGGKVRNPKQIRNPNPKPETCLCSPGGAWFDSQRASAPGWKRRGRATRLQPRRGEVRRLTVLPDVAYRSAKGALSRSERRHSLSCGEQNPGAFAPGYCPAPRRGKHQAPVREQGTRSGTHPIRGVSDLVLSASSLFRDSDFELRISSFPPVWGNVRVTPGIGFVAVMRGRWGAGKLPGKTKPRRRKSLADRGLTWLLDAPGGIWPGRAISWSGGGKGHRSDPGLGAGPGRWRGGLAGASVQ